MADVSTKISSVCSCLDLLKRTCRRDGRTCPFVEGKGYRACAASCFVAAVTINGDEFHVVLDADHRPTDGGFVPIRTCRDTTFHRAAGAYVNTILTTGPERSLLELERSSETEAKLICRDAGTQIQWTDGQFHAR